MAETATEQQAAELSVNDLLEAGLHFGHQSKRWNPKMKRFIFGKRNGIYIIDLTKTLAQLKEAQRFLREVVAQGRKVLFVGTKKQAQELIKETAVRCGQPYVNSRWLGGTLTNHKNIWTSVKRMRMIEDMEKQGAMQNLPQKEVSRLRHELTRHQRFLSGLAEMPNLPGALVVIDVNREINAVQEAARQQIPVVALVDTNSDPDLVAYPIPGNDDSSRAIRLVLNALAEPVARAAAEYAAVAAQRQAEAGAAEKQPAGESGQTAAEAVSGSHVRGRGARGGERRSRRGGGSGRDNRRGGARKEATTESTPAVESSSASAEATAAGASGETKAESPA